MEHVNVCMNVCLLSSKIVHQFFRPWYSEKSIEILYYTMFIYIYTYISCNLYVDLLEYRHLLLICIVENFFHFQHVQPARSLGAVPVRRAVFWPSSLIAVTPYVARHNEGSLRHRRWSNRHPPWWCCRHRWNWGRQLGLEGFWSLDFVGLRILWVVRIWTAKFSLQHNEDMWQGGHIEFLTWEGKGALDLSSYMSCEVGTVPWFLNFSCS